MDLNALYPWLVLAHVLTAFGFIALHGVSMAVVLRLGSERELSRIRSLLELSAWSLAGMYLFLLLVLATGIVAGIVGGWWTSGRLWIWVSVAILVGITVYMDIRGSGYFTALRGAAGLPANRRGREIPPGDPDPTRLTSLLAQRGRARELLVVGGIAVIALVYLMELKPF